MPRTLPFSAGLTSLLSRPFRRTSTHLRGERVAVVQPSAILRLPYEVFEEIFFSFPVLPWVEVYHRHLNESAPPSLASRMFWERARTLLALSATCRMIRQMVLMEAWKDHVMRRSPRVRFKRRVGVAPVSRCEILLGNPHLASSVRTLAVESVSGTYLEAELFVECLTTLPNLHTLEVAYAPLNQVVKYFVDALKKRDSQFQQVRKLVLPDAVHWLLRCCPNIEDLTCCGTAPGVDFVESLAAGGSNHITKLTVLCAGGSDIWRSLDIWPKVARACPGVRELSALHIHNARVFTLEKCIPAFENLSMVALICYTGSAYWGRWEDGYSGPVWTQVRDLAMGQLEGSSVGSPKKLKIVSLWGGKNNFGPESTVEEVVI